MYEHLLEPLSYQQDLGTIIATDSSPSTQRIDAVLKNEDIKITRGEFIEIPLSNKELIVGAVQEILKTNAYYSNAGVTKELSSQSLSASTIFPVDEWAATYVKVHPLGLLTEFGLGRIQSPPPPGTKIHRIRNEMLKIFFGLSSGPEGIHLGNISNSKTPVIVDMSRLFRKHLAILAISGAGKSYTTGVLLEEIIRRPAALGRLPVLIIDPHGEYSYLAKENIGESVVTVYPGRYYSIQTSTLTAWKLREYAPDISSVQVRELDKIISRLKQDHSVQALQDIINVIQETEDLNNRTRESLIGWLDGLVRTGLFGNVENPSIKDLIAPGQISIFDLSDIHSLIKKQIICSHIARTAFELRRDQNVSPFLLIIEEAHQFCPEQESSISKSIIETIAREGRKFFASLCLISQRPVRLSSTALSQCNTHLIMRIRNPYDLDYIGKLSEAIDKETQKFLPDLEVGEGILVGEAVNYPVLFKVRPKLFLGKRFEQSLLDELTRFESI